LIGQKLTVQEKWFSLDGVALDGKFIGQYHTSDSLVFSTFFKRDGGIFSPKKLFVTGTSMNPNTTITGMQNIQVKGYKPKRFSLGAGLYFEPFTQSIHLGIGIHYGLIRF
jgi:hypothetical protein